MRRGPFRGSVFLANPQHSLRYIWGLYEHELNPWLKKVVPKTGMLFDVGANHGYFSFGVAAHWRRMKRTGCIVAFEPQDSVVQRMLESRSLNQLSEEDLIIHQTMVGHCVSEQATCLNSVLASLPHPMRNVPTLVKIDVEGAELEVLAGATHMITAGNFFCVEVHSLALLQETKRFFSEHSHQVDVIHQHSLPFIGREMRDEENYWVISTC